MLLRSLHGSLLSECEMDLQLSPKKTVELSLPYSPERPMPLQEWQQLSEALDPIDQGKVLSGILWRQQGLCILDSQALENLPSEVAEGVKFIMHRQAIDHSWDLSHEETSEREVSLPIYPEYTTAHDRSYSILSAAVDHNLVWHLLVVMNDERGNLIGPQLSSQEGLASAPLALHNRDHFIGVHMKIQPIRVPTFDSSIRQRYSWEVALLLSPFLEQGSLHGVSAISSGKIGDIATLVRNRALQEASSEFRLLAKTFPNERAAWMVIESVRDTGGNVVIEYEQEHGVLGDYTAFGPFVPFNETTAKRLIQHTPSASLEDRLHLFEEARGGDILTKASNEALSTVAQTPLSLAIQHRRCKPLPNSASFHIDQVRMLACDYDTKTAVIEIIASIKMGKDFVLPCADDSPLRFGSPEGIAFSLEIANLKGRSPAQVTYQALREISRCVVPEIGGEFKLSYSALLLSAPGFSAALGALASTDPTQSPLYPFVMNAIESVFRSTFHAANSPEWRGISFETTPDPEDDHQYVSLLVRHSLGFSRFQVVRSKDTGVVVVNNCDEPGGIAHLSSIPLPTV